VMSLPGVRGEFVGAPISTSLSAVLLIHPAVS
jgi:hypothetical protein